MIKNISNAKEAPNQLISEFSTKYIKYLSQWFGGPLNLTEDFDLICQCELDFIEILLLGEQKFKVNLLESSTEREDFNKVIDFINWAETKTYQK